MTSALEASELKTNFFAFPILLDGIIAPIDAIFLMQKQEKLKIGTP
jgi:hypothetical protein